MGAWKELPEVTYPEVAGFWAMALTFLFNAKIHFHGKTSGAPGNLLLFPAMQLP